MTYHSEQEMIEDQNCQGQYEAEMGKAMDEELYFQEQLKK